MKTGLYILAAGASKRLGQPKQLLKYKDSTLLNHVIKTCQESNFESIKVILGASYDLIIDTLPTDIPWILNKDWQKGMSSSIIKAVEDGQSNYDGIIIVTADQPAINPHVLNLLLEEITESGSTIIASRYEYDLGPPVYFCNKFFPELCQLSGDRGAKTLVNKYANEVRYIPFPLGHIDIDSTNDLSALDLDYS